MERIIFTKNINDNFKYIETIDEERLVRNKVVEYRDNEVFQETTFFSYPYEESMRYEKEFYSNVVAILDDFTPVSLYSVTSRNKISKENMFDYYNLIRTFDFQNKLVKRR